MKKNFDELRSQMGEARIADSNERAQKMLDEILVEGLESGKSVPADDAYWADLRKRVADKAGGKVSGYGSLKNDVPLGTKAQER